MRLKTVMLVIAVSCLIVLYVLFSRKNVKNVAKIKIHDLDEVSMFIGTLHQYQKNCTFHSCFNVLNCQSLISNKISVGIHSMDNLLTREHISIIKGVKESVFYTDEYLSACVTILPYFHKKGYNASFFNNIKMR